MKVTPIEYTELLKLARSAGDPLLELVPQGELWPPRNCWFPSWHKWRMIYSGPVIGYFHCDRCNTYGISLNWRDAMKLWVVGKTRSGEFPNIVWDLNGVYDSEELAVAACRDENYFVGSIMLNESLPDETEEWPGAYYPKTV